MRVWIVLVLVLGAWPRLTYPIRCYKCDASADCRMLSARIHDYSADNVEIIDCEHFCWKAVSLGNVYRGCAKKRCVVSHTMGSFSSSACCQTDYCNGSSRLTISNNLFMTYTFFLLLLVGNRDLTMR